MKKTLLVMAMAIALAMSMMAGAFAEERAEEMCYLNYETSDYDTPGAMFQAIRDIDDSRFDSGTNPHEWVQYWRTQYEDDPQTVGEFIHRNCFSDWDG